MDHRAEDLAVIGARPHQGDARSVTEQARNRRAACRVIEAGRMHLSAGDEHVVVRPAAHELVGDGEPEQEAGALCAYIERTHGAAPQSVLQKAPGAGKVTSGSWWQRR